MYIKTKKYRAIWLKNYKLTLSYHLVYDKAGVLKHRIG